MRKIICLTLLLIFLSTFAFADRNASTITEYSSSQLIKRGDGKVYRIYFNPTSNGGFFALHDISTLTDASSTNAKAEGIEATANNGQPQDFTAKPLEFSTGIYLVITSGKVLVEYE